MELKKNKIALPLVMLIPLLLMCLRAQPCKLSGVFSPKPRPRAIVNCQAKKVQVRSVRLLASVIVDVFAPPYRPLSRYAPQVPTGYRFPFLAASRLVARGPPAVPPLS
jgi:hypothetical protein